MTEERRSCRRIRWRGWVIIARWRWWDGRWMMDVGVRMGMGVRVRQRVLMRMRGEEEGRRVRRRMRRCGGYRGTIHVQSWVLFLPLGSSILEPDLHLGLRQRERQGQVQTFADREVSGGLELVLQSDQLFVRERGPGSSRLATGAAASAGSVLAALVLTLTTLSLNAAGRRRGRGRLSLLAVGRWNVAHGGGATLPASVRGLLVRHPHLHVLVILLLHVRILVHVLHARVRCALLVLLAAAAGELAPRVPI